MAYQTVGSHAARYNQPEIPFLVHGWFTLFSSHVLLLTSTLIKVLEKYQVYGDSVLWRDGKKPNVRDIVKVQT